MSARHQSITIKHVANQAGVSTQTVSRVINDRPDVAPETRRRVLEVIDQLDYHPNALARGLIQRRSYTLGMVTAGLKFVGPSRTLNGITTTTEELGYALLLKELPRFDIQDIQPIIHFLLSRQVDGLLWALPEIGNNRDWVQEGIAEIPVPVVFLTMQFHPGLSIVSVDNRLGGRLATRHLLEQGYRHIGHISGPLDWWEARQRKAGWEDVLKKAGLPVDDRQCVEGSWSSPSGEAVFQQLLESYPEMDSVFVANDQMALAVLQVAHRLGMQIPQDLGVVGFDNLTESAYFWPPLTTLNQNQYELGRQAVLVLVKQIEASRKAEKAAEQQSILLPPELVVRESSVA